MVMCINIREEQIQEVGWYNGKCDIESKTPILSFNSAALLTLDVSLKPQFLHL